MSQSKELTSFDIHCQSIPLEIRNIIVGFSGVVVDKLSYARKIESMIHNTDLFIKIVNPGDSFQAFIPDAVVSLIDGKDFSHVSTIEDRFELGEPSSIYDSNDDDVEICLMDINKQKMRTNINDQEIQVISPIHFEWEADFNAQHDDHNYQLEVTTACHTNLGSLSDLTYHIVSKSRSIGAIHDKKCIIGKNFMKLSPTNFSIYALNLFKASLKKVKNYKMFYKNSNKIVFGGRQSEVFLKNLFIKVLIKKALVRHESFRDCVGQNAIYQMLDAKEEMLWSKLNDKSLFIFESNDAHPVYKLGRNTKELAMKFYDNYLHYDDDDDYDVGY